MNLTYLYLAVAILAEVIATTALKTSDGFSRLWPSALSVTGYCISFYFLSQTMKVIPTGIIYAVWSGAGIVLISTVGWLWMGQTLDKPALLGIGLIIAGVVVINLFSKSVPH